MAIIDQYGNVVNEKEKIRLLQLDLSIKRDEIARLKEQNDDMIALRNIPLMSDEQWKAFMNAAEEMNKLKLELEGARIANSALVKMEAENNNAFKMQIAKLTKDRDLARQHCKDGFFSIIQTKDEEIATLRNALEVQRQCRTCPAGIPLTMIFCEDCSNTTKPKPTNEPQMTALEKLMSRIVRDVDVAGSLEDPEIVSYNCSHNEFENIRIDLGATTQKITMQYDGYELTYASLSVAAPNYKDEEQDRLVYVFDISTERYAKINTQPIGTVLALAGLAGAALTALCTNQAPQVRAAEQIDCEPASAEEETTKQQEELSK